ncbi:unnamed protein product, partial [marine sediment metagenome]
MEYEKKDEDTQIASALRSMGMQIDHVAMEIILTVSDRVRLNKAEGKETTLTEINDLKTEVEKAMAPQMQQMP